MNKLRLLHVVETLCPSGTIRTLSSVVARTACVFEHRVIAFQGGCFADRLAEGGAEVRVLANSATTSLATRIQAIRAANSTELGLLHLWDNSSRRIVGPLSAALDRAPYILSVRDPVAPETWIGRRIENLVLDRAAAVIFNSSSLRDTEGNRLADRATADERLTVIDDVAAESPREPRNRREQNLRRELGIDDDILVVGVATRLTCRKDVRCLIFAGALMRLASERVRIVILGDGPELKALHRFCALMRMDDLTVFMGSRLDAPSLIADFDVFVDCAVADGPSLGIAEAQAAGVPVVCADSPSRRAQVEAEVDGLLFKAGDPGDLTRRLYQLNNDVELRLRLGKAGAEKSRRRRSLAEVAGDFTALYESVAKR